MSATLPGSPNSDYSFRPLEFDAGTLDACAAMLGEVLSPVLRREFLHWQYVENPAGPATGFNAFANGVLAGHYATIPVEALIDGRVKRGLLSLNTATHEAHRGKGLFTRLAERTYQRAREQGFDFVVGVANSKSTQGFTGKLGFQLVAPLDVWAGLGEFQSDRREHANGFALHWSDVALRWRLQRPGALYCAGAERNGSQTILAQISTPGFVAVMERVPSLISSRLRPVSAATPARLWIGLDTAMRRPALSLAVPDALKPSPLNLVYLDLQEAGRTINAKQVYWSLLDFDAY